MEIRFWINLYERKYLYDKIYTIGYYSGFYSSLRDKIWGNGGQVFESVIFIV